MQLPLQITFRNMDPSDAVEANVREKAAKLDGFLENIMACRVVVEAQHRHHHKGNLYSARIDITVPGHEIVVSRTPGKDHAHEDVYVAVRDAETLKMVSAPTARPLRVLAAARLGETRLIDNVPANL